MIYDIGASVAQIFQQYLTVTDKFQVYYLHTFGRNSFIF